MRRLLTALCAGLCLFIAAEAQAKRGGGWAQELLFLSETQIPGENGQNLSLCILAKQRTIIGFVNLWKSPESYVLASDKCAVEQYIPLEDAAFKAGQAEGVFPAELALPPKLGLKDQIVGAWGLGALLLLIVAAIVKTIGSRRRAAGRKAALGTMTDFQHRVIEVMCQAAFTDGEIASAEVDTIVSVAKNLTGQTYSVDQVRQIIASCDKNISDMKFKSYGKGLNEEEKITLIRAAMMVFAADGQLAKKEHTFLGKLAGGLGLSADKVRAILNPA